MTRFLVFLTSALLIIHQAGCSVTDGFIGKVTDANTGQPVIAAVVIAIYYEDAGFNIAGAGGPKPVDCRETLTDSKGEFRLRRELSQAFLGAKLLVAKVGYGSSLSERTLFMVDGDKVDKSRPPTGRYITIMLPPLKAPKEMMECGLETFELSRFFQTAKMRKKLPEYFRLKDEHLENVQRHQMIIIKQGESRPQNVAPLAK